MVVYKIVATEEWIEAEAAGVFAGASVDRADGFIHFSTAEQAPETAAKWFAGRGDLSLAAIDAEALGQGPALGAVARRRAFPSSLCPPADERGRLVASAAARIGRRPCFREPRGVRLAKMAGPVLRRLPAETAHRAAINALKIAPPASAPSSDPRLAVEVLGLTFPNPLGLAAGFDKNAEVPGAMLRLGFGFVEVGTLTPRPQDGNARPRLFRLSEDAAVINRFGFNNEGFARARARLERRRRPRAGLLGVNIGANKDAADRVEDYVLGVRTFAPFADYLTINVSSPNTPGIAGPAAARGAGRPDRAGGRRPRRDRAAPPADAQDRARSRRPRARGHCGDGPCASHRRPHRLEHHGRAACDVDLEEPRRNRRPVGRPLFEPSTRLLARTYLLTGGAMPLIGVGGVEDAKTALAKIEAGANLVQLYTGLALKGPGVVKEILDGLTRTVEARGVKRIGELVGARAGDWADRERSEGRGCARELIHRISLVSRRPQSTGAGPPADGSAEIKASKR